MRKRYEKVTQVGALREDALIMCLALDARGLSASEIAARRGHSLADVRSALSLIKALPDV